MRSCTQTTNIPAFRRYEPAVRMPSFFRLFTMRAFGQFNSEHDAKTGRTICALEMPAPMASSKIAHMSVCLIDSHILYANCFRQGL